MWAAPHSHILSYYTQQRPKFKTIRGDLSRKSIGSNVNCTQNRKSFCIDLVNRTVKCWIFWFSFGPSRICTRTVTYRYFSKYEPHSVRMCIRFVHDDNSMNTFEWKMAKTQHHKCVSSIFIANLCTEFLFRLIDLPTDTHTYKLDSIN